jgi:UDP-N-acetylglucosamine:LPS N-acetylglucosamine transferase
MWEQMSDHHAATATTGSTPVGPSREPRRVLVVSADMGGGHNATAAALEEAVGRVWPLSEVRRIDALDVMGGWVGDSFRDVYVTNVESTPWLYEFFYSSLWRHRWFAQASKRFVGTWCGRRLVRHIDAFDPDLVLSTYPLGSAGLAWLIRHRALTVPVACWVSDYAPHPFWVYREVAANYLVDPAAVPAATCAEPEARHRVSALPVVSRFRPMDRAAARAELGLRPDALVTLIGCGSYAFGDVVSLVRTVAEVSERIQVVAACGRNDEIRRRLEDLGLPQDRVVPLGWTTKMPTVTAAADLVIGNAGGATALEAMACGVPVVLTEPIAAHGAANADLMAVAGAAELCSDGPALAAYVRAAVERRDADPGAVSAGDGSAAANGHRSAVRNGDETSVWNPGTAIARGDGDAAEGSGVAAVHDGGGTAVRNGDGAAVRNGDGAAAGPGDDTSTPDADRTTGLDRDVAAVVRLSNVGRSPRSRSWPMRAADAFFCHVESTGALQELGVVLELGPDPAGHAASLAAIRASMQDRTSLPSTRRILLRDRPGWRLAHQVDTADHIDEIVLDAADRDARWDAAGDFFARAMPPGRPAWQMRLIRTGSEPGTLFAIKMHHSQADGISALGLLDRLLDPADDDPLPERRSLPNDLTAGGRDARIIGRGLLALASRGFAPRHPLGARPLSDGRQLVPASVPWSAVRALARRCEVSVTEAAIGLAAHALHGVLAPTGLLTGGAPLRAMVPVAMRAARLDREFGNWTGSLAVDLDMADRPLDERVGLVRDELRRRSRDGEAPAAAAVMAVAGALPAPVHRAFTRAVYHRRFFSTVVSFMPGARRARWLAGAPVTGMTPVLPLAPRVPVTLGMILTDGRLDIGVLLDRQLRLPRGRIDSALARTLAEVG